MLNNPICISHQIVYKLVSVPVDACLRGIAFGPLVPVKLGFRQAEKATHCNWRSNLSTISREFTVLA